MRQYDVAAYIWPEKDGEWYTVRRGTPRFPGHDMPRIPLLVYQDEAEPAVMRQHVELAMARWSAFEAVYGTFYPHVSIGWDNAQRNPSFGADHVVAIATPDAFEAWLDARPQQAPLLTINSWNEWTEGSYLLPDMRLGYRFLQAVRKVFG